MVPGVQHLVWAPGEVQPNAVCLPDGQEDRWYFLPVLNKLVQGLQSTTVCMYLTFFSQKARNFLSRLVLNCSLGLASGAVHKPLVQPAVAMLSSICLL